MLPLFSLIRYFTVWVDSPLNLTGQGKSVPTLHMYILNGGGDGSRYTYIRESKLYCK